MHKYAPSTFHHLGATGATGATGASTLPSCARKGQLHFPTLSLFDHRLHGFYSLFVRTNSPPCLQMLICLLLLGVSKFFFYICNVKLRRKLTKNCPLTPLTPKLAKVV
jgi:hypothetical protein